MSWAQTESCAVNIPFLRVHWALTSTCHVVRNRAAWTILDTLFLTANWLAHTDEHASWLTIFIAGTAVLSRLLTVSWDNSLLISVVALSTLLTLEVDLVVTSVESSAHLTMVTTKFIVHLKLSFSHSEAASNDCHVAWLTSLTVL